MSAGSLLLTCLLGVLHTTPPDLHPINKNKLEIPIRIAENRQQDIQSLELWMSTNQGKNWDLVAQALPSDKFFPFTAPTDGIYWFGVVVIDQNKGRDPADLSKAPVALKVLIDSKPPEVRLLPPQRQGDQIVVQWDIRDENPDLASFKLEYKNIDAPGDWIPVAVQPGLNGQTSIRVPHGALVRVQIKDLAGNERKSEEVKVPMTAEPVAMSGGGPALSGAPTPSPVAPAPTPVLPAPPAGPPPLPTTTPVTPVPVTPAPSTPAPTPPTAMAPPGPREWAPIQPMGGTTAQPHGKQIPGETVIAMSSPGVDRASFDTTAPATPAPTGGSLPPIQVVKERQVTMEYEVSKFGPSGVGSVDLYVTRDDGQTWQKFVGETPPAAGSPTPEIKDSMRRTLTVELPNEGVYGFFMVVKSGAGLSKPGPKPGDAPQMRLELDSHLPDIKMYEPMLDGLQRNALVVKWQVTDKNLAPNPITIEWSERPGGPWTPIGTAQMSNSGSYSWQVPPTIPPRVFLRLSARDTAGNVAVAETPRPVLVDLNMPDVKIIGLAVKPGQ